MVGIDADAPLGRTLGQRRLDPGAGRLVLEHHERVGLAGLLIEHVKPATNPGTDLIVSRRYWTLASSRSAGWELKVARRASIGPS